MTNEPLRPAVFLDRDGTLNVEVEGALRDPADLELLPGAAAAVARLNRAGLLVVLCTNQSAIARGWMGESDLEAVQNALRRELATHGAHLDGEFHCPHHPTEGRPPLRRPCSCRKPAPGMLRAAAERLRIDLSRSWVVGDAERDLQAGAALGLPGVLVRTGKGEAELARLRAAGRPPQHVADLAAAADRILAQAGGAGRDQGR